MRDQAKNAVGAEEVVFGRGDFNPHPSDGVFPVIIGGDGAVIAVPVMAQTLKGSEAQWREAAVAGADVIEWRVDALENVDRQDETKASSQEVTAQRIADLGKAMRVAHKKPVLATARTSLEGGNFPIEGAEDAEAYLRLAQDLGSWADAVDVEISREGALEAIKVLDVPVVASFHQFSGPVDEAALQRVMKRMERSGAAVAKVACMVETPSDLEAVKRVAAWAGENLRVPSVVIGMGEAGQETRLGKHAAAAAFTFAVAGAASAPGQLGIETVRESLPK